MSDEGSRRGGKGMRAKPGGRRKKNKGGFRDLWISFLNEGTQKEPRKNEVPRRKKNMTSPRNDE
jgi:hypothetical protein